MMITDSKALGNARKDLSDLQGIAYWLDEYKAVVGVGTTTLKFA